MWFEHCVFYQIYPLTLCGAPQRNPAPAAADETPEPAHGASGEPPMARIGRFIPYLKDLGIGGVYLNPVFESDSHGYDTRDYRKIDRRLGSNEEFVHLVSAFHDNGIRVVLDGVFNHVGRGFPPFQDLLKNRAQSRYAGWFHVDFNGDTPYHDGLWYKPWEGHYELVSLNLENPEVQNYLLDSVRLWFRDFDIDGIRLDVCYLLPTWFTAMIKDTIRAMKPDAFLLGEILGDNAGRFYTEGHVDAITDYPGYKALWSSFNSLNLFELAHTVRRNYQEMYRGRMLFSFADNHDVDRIASRLSDPEKLPLLYGLLFTLPGYPCIYYGSEWGAEGKKGTDSDAALRPAFAAPLPNALTERLRRMIELRNDTPELETGEYRELALTNRAFAFSRTLDGKVTIAAVNLDEAPVQLSVPDRGNVEIAPKSFVVSRRGGAFQAF